MKIILKWRGYIITKGSRTIALWILQKTNKKGYIETHTLLIAMTAKGFWRRWR